MSTEHLLFLALALAAGLLMMKYIYWQIGWHLRERAELEQNPEKRQEKIQELSYLLAQKPADAEALLFRATLLYRHGEHAAAADDLQKYLALKPKDAEGWAELSECRILLGDAAAAEDAARRAIELDPQYADYRMLRLRSCLLAKRLENAQEELAEWTKLDEARVNRPEEPRSWFSPPKQIPEGEIVSDPALKIYGAAIRLAAGDSAAAAAILRDVRTTHADYLDLLLQTDPLLKNLAQL